MSYNILQSIFIDWGFFWKLYSSCPYINRVSIRFCILLIQLLHSLYTIFLHLLYNVTLWHPNMWPWCVTLSCNTFPYFFLVVSSDKKKIYIYINNNLTILPSHDTIFLSRFLVLRTLQLIVWVNHIVYFIVILFGPFLNF